ncbi:hypothetical protein DSM07_05955 [Oenococcus sp. UCMA 16435]|nr:hypothetical protein DSM07_05955 [Oenococcus sp. UCMA 16435]
MGYGKKVDYKLGKSIDLDKIYTKLIESSLKSFSKIDNVRGDEISSSEIIDTDMFELLLSADIVVADITTLNPNAIYELGIRHALKPYSTIILGLNEDELPFDFSHNRIFRYSWGDINNEELLQKKRRSLRKLLKNTIYNLDQGHVNCDSPFYEYVKDINAPKISQAKLEEIRAKHYDSLTIRSLTDQANELKKEDKYLETSDIYKSLSLDNPNNPYYKQQRALFLSKVVDANHNPDKTSLTKAEEIIKKLNPFASLDSETTGIYGAIEKRLFICTKSTPYLENAIKSYNRSFVLSRNYYNGENVVNCLLYKLSKSNGTEEQAYLKYRIKIVNKEVLKLAEREYERQLSESSDCDYWLSATISLSCLLEGQNDQYIQYRQLFFDHLTYDWEKESYQTTESLRQDGLNELNK